MQNLYVIPRLIVSILTVLLLINGVQSIGYGQPDTPTITPGETNTYLVVSFEITLDDGVDENAYQIQVRRKSPPSEWISKCVAIKRGIRHETDGDPYVFASAIYVSTPIFHFSGRSDKTFIIRAIFTDLEPGTSYEGRYRDTNLPECVQNPPAPEAWSETGEGTTHMVTPDRAEFVDANFASNVRWKLGLDTNRGYIDLLKIPQASLAELTKLELSDEEITDITGLEYATQLADLDLSYNQISNISPLAQLTQLIYLDLSDNQISDISALGKLLQLMELELDRNQISDITPLAQLTKLTELGLWDNQINNISPLAGLPNLRWLSLSSNQISDVVPLTAFASIGSLRNLFLKGNPISDTAPVRKLKREYPNLSISIDIPVILTDPGNEPDLYVLADGYSIFQLNLNGINIQKMGPKSFRHYDIAIDVMGGKIYWSRRDKIQRANLDGTSVQDVVTGLDEPEGIALDISGGKIYWTEEHDPRIQRANLDGTNVLDAVTGLNRPYRIALDIPGSKIYWIEDRGHRIQRANLDGTNVQDVVTGLDEPEDIAIDVSGATIYWTENGGRQIQRANLDGSDAHVIVPDLAGAPRGIALDIARDKIYWTDYSNNGIWRANLDGSNVHVVAIGVSNPTAIAVHASVRFAPHTSVTLSPSPARSTAIGDQLEISLKIIGGEGITGFRVTVQFDTTALRYLSSANGNYLPEGASFAERKVDGNLVELNAASLAGESIGEGILATLIFEAVAVKDSTLTLSNVLLTNSAGEHLVPTVENAEITDEFGTVVEPLGNRITSLGNIKRTSLLQNYPNPFNPDTWIPYQLASDAYVTLSVFDQSGHIVRAFDIGSQKSGIYQDKANAAYWDGRNQNGEPVTSGTYYYQFRAGDYTALKQMVITK